MESSLKIMAFLGLMLAALCASTIGCSKGEDNSDAAVKGFKNCTPVFINEQDTLVGILNNAMQTNNFVGLQEAAAPNFQRLEDAQADMAANAQNLSGEARVIADKMLTTAQEIITLDKALMAAGQQGDTENFKNYSDKYKVLKDQMNDLKDQWNSSLD